MSPETKAALVAVVEHCAENMQRGPAGYVVDLDDLLERLGELGLPREEAAAAFNAKLEPTK